MSEIAYEADEITAETSEWIRFRDCGVNLETIRCPICKVQLSIDWWKTQMPDEECWDDAFELKPITLPCGDVADSLNDLDYDFDQGFSRFILDVMNPRIGQLDDSDISRLEEILGCRIKIIYQHV